MILKVSGRTMLPVKEVGLVYMPGAYAHAECVWPNTSPTPHLTWEQMDAITQLVTTIQLPKNEHRTRKLLGAIRVAWFNKHHAPKAKPSDPGLALGEDHLEGYRFILALTEREGPWFEPVGYDGRPWVRPSTAAPARPVVLEPVEGQEPKGKRVKEFAVHPLVADLEAKDMLDDGYWVRGTLITPIKFCLMTPINVHIRPVDRPGLDNWMIVPNYQVVGTLAEAQADVMAWQERQGIAVGQR